jgi:hypothetical protein
MPNSLAKAEFQSWGARTTCGYTFCVEMRSAPDDFDVSQTTIDTAAIDNIIDFISHTTIHLN